MARYVVRFEECKDIGPSNSKQRKEAKEIIDTKAPTHIDKNQGAGTLIKGKLVRLDLQGQFNLHNIRYANLQIQLNAKRGNEEDDEDNTELGKSTELVHTDDGEEIEKLTDAIKITATKGDCAIENSACGTESNMLTDEMGNPIKTTIAIVLMPSGEDIPNAIVQNAWTGSLDNRQKATIVKE